MGDFFDELKVETGLPGGKSGDFFDELMEEEATGFNTGMEIAKKKNPDSIAKAYAESDQSGLPVDYHERNPDKQPEEDFDYNALRERSPLLAEMLQEKRNAEIAQNELDNLSWFEEVARETKNIGRVAYASTFSISTAGYGVLSSVMQSVEAIPRVPLDYAASAAQLLDRPEIAKSLQEISYDLGVTSRIFLHASQQTAAARAYYMPKPGETRAHKAVLSGIESALINIPAIAATIATRNPNVGLGLMGSISYGGAYTEAQTKGLNNFDSFVYATNNAIAEVVTEKLPLGTLLNDINKGTGFTKMLAKQMVSEGITEQIATVWQDANKWAMLNPEKTLSEFIAERPDAAYNTLISTMVATGLQTSAIAGINKIAGQSDQAVIEAIVEKANESNYRNLDKANFESYLQEVAEEYGGVDHLYIDAKSARAAMEEMEQDDSYQILEEQIEEAERLNGDIVIPVGEFASSVATSPNFALLKDSIRLTPDSDTVVINAFEKIQEANKSIERNEETRRIFNEVSNQLKATGKLTQQQAKLSAEIIPAFLGANPERMGLTVTEAYEMMGLKIIGPTKDLDIAVDEKANELLGVIDSVKEGVDSQKSKDMISLLESQGIDINQSSDQIVSALSKIKEFKQETTTEEVVKSDPLTETQDWRSQTVTATLDDGTKQDINAGEAYDIIAKRKENAQSILDCINANS